MSIENVIKPTSHLPKYKHSEFPAMYWKADGSNYVAKTAADVLPDTTPYHPDNAPKVEAKAPAPGANELPLSKDEVVAALSEGGITHNPNKSHAKLYSLLLAAVKAALDEAAIAYDAAETNVKTLMALLPSG